MLTLSLLRPLFAHLGHPVSEVHVPGDLVTISVGHHHVEESVTPGLMVSQTQVPEGLVTQVTQVPILRLCDGLSDCLHAQVRHLTVLYIMTPLSLHSPQDICQSKQTFKITNN